jgi:GT2 family glycosyltransferase
MRREERALKSLAVVVINYRTESLTARCVQTATQDLPVQPKVIVVDVGSSARSAEYLRQNLDPSVDVVSLQENRGYGHAANKGVAAAANASYLLILNSDCLVTGAAIEGLLRSLNSDPGVGVIAPAHQRKATGEAAKVSHRFRTVQREWQLLRHGPRHSNETPESGSEEWIWLTGACLLFRAEAFYTVKGFSEDYFMYAEDIDVCWRLQEAGWLVRADNDVEVLHLSGQSSQSTWNSRQIEQRKIDSESRFYTKVYGRGTIFVITLIRIVRILSGRSTGTIGRRHAVRLLSSALCVRQHRAGGSFPVSEQ